MSFTTNMTHGELQTLVERLEANQAAKHDVIVPAEKIRSFNGIVIGDSAGSEEVVVGDTLEELRTERSHLAVRPTAWMDGQIAAKLDIPSRYLARCRAENVDLYDANFNGWMARETKPYLIRSFVGDDGEPGIGRALLSDQGWGMDDLDALYAGLSGLQATGRDFAIADVAISATKFMVRVVVPEITALAPTLLERYMVPRQVTDAGWDFGYGYSGPITDPVVFAGIEFGNSEVGGGAFYVVPRLVVLKCNNGLKQTVDMVRAVHVGSKLDEGVVAWSADTIQKNVELIRAKARDAVNKLLTQDYLDRVIAGIEAKAGREIAEPEKVIEVIASKLAIPQAQRELIFSHFVQGGQMTAGGVLNAVTSAAQFLDDADDAADLESKAMRALELAAV